MGGRGVVGGEGDEVGWESQRRREEGEIINRAESRWFGVWGGGGVKKI